MNDETNAEKKIQNFILQIPEGMSPVSLFLGNNLITGPVLVGDKIKDQATGRVFEVVGRTWLSGEDRKANIAILLKELLIE